MTTYDIPEINLALVRKACDYGKEHGFVPAPEDYRKGDCFCLVGIVAESLGWNLPSEGMDSHESDLAEAMGRLDSDLRPGKGAICFRFDAYIESNPRATWDDVYEWYQTTYYPVKELANNA